MANLGKIFWLVIGTINLCMLFYNCFYAPNPNVVKVIWEATFVLMADHRLCVKY